MFNVFDVIGRTIGGIPMFMIDIERRFLLHLFAFSRILIIVLVIVVSVGAFSDSLQVQNGLIIFDPFLLAITNGYVQTIFSCYAASLVSKTQITEYHSIALGNLLAIALTLGISVGGLLQIPFAKI